MAETTRQDTYDALESDKDAGGLNLTELNPDMPMPPVSKKKKKFYENEIPDKPKSSAELEAVFDVPVQVAAVLGKSSMQVHQLLKLGRGAVIELDRKIGEAIDIYVNNRLVARGEVVVVEDRLGITMTEIIKAERN